jgi:hypothetical protein
MEKKIIKIKYHAKPNTPNSICHKFPVRELTELRIRKFDIVDKDKAWRFLSECTWPKTTLKQILFAFKPKRAKAILDVMDDNIISETGRIIPKEIESIENTVDLKYAMSLQV